MIDWIEIKFLIYQFYFVDLYHSTGNKILIFVILADNATGGNIHNPNWSNSVKVTTL